MTSWTDRLARIVERRGGMEKRSLNTFGTVLCDRAAVYQNAYSLATAQLTGAAPKATFPRLNARVNQINSKEKEGVFMKGSSRPFCFKCKVRKLRIHFWLWRPTRDFVFYTQWTVLRMLHSARNSNQTKPGEEDGCGIPHHPLLHEKYRVTKTTWTAIARTMDQANADTAMGIASTRSAWSRRKTNIGQRIQIHREQYFLDAARICESSQTRGQASRIALEGAGGVISPYKSEKLSIQIPTTSGQVHVLKC